MLRAALFILCILSCCLSSDPAHTACAPSPASDGGSVCLPEGWTVLPWDDIPGESQQLTEGATLCTQTVFAARTQGAKEEVVAMMVSRMAAVMDSGNLVDVDPLDVREMTEKAARSAKDPLFSGPKAVTAGGLTLWRVVYDEPGRTHLKAVYRVFASKAAYQLMLAIPKTQKGRLDEYEKAVLEVWRPGDAPMRMLTVAPDVAWHRFDSPYLPGVRLALPEGWKTDLSGTLDSEPLSGGGTALHRVLAVQARGELPGHGRAVLDLRVMWQTDMQGRPYVMPEQVARDFGDAVLTGLSQRYGMTRRGTAVDYVGPIRLHVRFYSLPDKPDQIPLVATAVIIPGARRMMAATLIHAAEDAAYWRGVLIDMLRQWELNSEGALNLLPMAGGS